MSVFALRLKRLHVGVRGHTHWLLITLRVGMCARGFLSCCGDGGVKAEPPQGKQSFDVTPVLQHGNLPAALAAGYTIINPSTALLPILTRYPPQGKPRYMLRSRRHHGRIELQLS